MARQFFINADGLGEEARLKVELLDHFLKPLPGYSGDDAATGHCQRFSGAGHFRREIRQSPACRSAFKVRVTFEGERRTDIRFSAMYVR